VYSVIYACTWWTIRCSWATLHTTAEPPYEVRQGGHRKLWDEVETAYRWWVEAGEPAGDAWRFTVTPSGQRVELPGCVS
jgi:hypothetical protein